MKHSIHTQITATATTQKSVEMAERVATNNNGGITV